MVVKFCYNFELTMFLFSIFGKQRPVCYSCLNNSFQYLNNSFQYLNNITSIFTYFFTHTYFQKIQTILLEILTKQTQTYCVSVLLSDV